GGDAEKGIAGARILSCQIFDLYGAQPDIYQAIKHGADHGAVILQCSWGFSPDLDHDGFTTDDEIALYRSYTIDDLPEYKAVLDYFIKYAGCDNDGNQLPDSPMKGGVAIFAAGNDNFDYDPLVSYEPIIAVGAFGATGNKASYSNYGDWVDIAAPGGDGKQGIYSTLVGNSSYGGSDWQGTSMACPHVSGVAALLVSYFGGPGFTAEECRARILRGARANFFDSSRYIGKKLDAYGAFTVDLNKPVLPPVLAWSGEQPAMLGKEESASFVFTCEDPAGQRLFYALTPEIPGIALGENAVLVDAAQLKPGKYTLTLTARNEDHLSTQISASFEVLSNQAPVTTESCPKTGFIVPCGTSQTVDVSSWFQDPDGDALRFSAQVQQQDLAKASCSEEGQLTMEGLRPGITEVLVRASDGETATDVVLPLAVPQAGKSLFLFPEVATNQVYVAYHVATPVKATVTLASASGARLWQTETELDAFHPVLINLRDCAPGVYTVHIQGNGIAEVLSFAKI
ncbi:MAG: S8 family serine peptidase, partial [Candidatus Cryptobacteroides sp.]|nr:S8 family serine peptidase [Candidatus Cryptobacteroides sp.]